MQIHSEPEAKDEDQEWDPKFRRFGVVKRNIWEGLITDKSQFFESVVSWVEFFLRHCECVVIELDLVWVVFNHLLVLSYVEEVVDLLDSDDSVVKHTVVSLLACVKGHLSATELCVIESSSPYILSCLLNQCFIHLSHLRTELLQTWR